MTATLSMTCAKPWLDFKRPRVQERSSLGAIAAILGPLKPRFHARQLEDSLAALRGGLSIHGIWSTAVIRLAGEHSALSAREAMQRRMTFPLSLFLSLLFLLFFLFNDESRMRRRLSLAVERANADDKDAAAAFRPSPLPLSVHLTPPPPPLVIRVRKRISAVARRICASRHALNATTREDARASEQARARARGRGRVYLRYVIHEKNIQWKCSSIGNGYARRAPHCNLRRSNRG